MFFDIGLLYKECNIETGYTSDVDLETYEVEYTSLLEEGFMPVEEE